MEKHIGLQHILAKGKQKLLDGATLILSESQSVAVRSGVMTISYNLAVASADFGAFARILLRWRGGLYQAIWKELVCFLIAFFTLNFCYRFAMTEDEKKIFRKISTTFSKLPDYVPLIFILGFYVNLVVKRWWEQFVTIPWPDKIAQMVGLYVIGKDERGRMLRRTIMRQVNLGGLLGLRMVSSAAVKRFPTLLHLVEAGFMTEEELDMLSGIEMDRKYPKFIVPCQWACQLIYKARKEGRIEQEVYTNGLINEVITYRASIDLLTKYDWICVPLVYTQVVTLAVYIFFLGCLIGRQYTAESTYFEWDIFNPIATVLQFLFYVGMLKVAETHLNPMGEDADDFEINFIIERNLHISYLLADTIYDQLPTVERDLHWGVAKFEIPHTAASYGVKSEAFMGSASEMEFSSRQQEIVVVATQPEEVEDSDDLVDLMCDGQRSGHKLSRVSVGTNLTESPRPREAVRKIWRKISRAAEMRRFSRSDSIRSSRVDISPRSSAVGRRKLTITTRPLRDSDVFRKSVGAESICLAQRRLSEDFLGAPTIVSQISADHNGHGQIQGDQMKVVLNADCSADNFAFQHRSESIGSVAPSQLDTISETENDDQQNLEPTKLRREDVAGDSEA